jgi:hypothetical protein
MARDIRFETVANRPAPIRIYRIEDEKPRRAAAK